MAEYREIKSPVKDKAQFIKRAGKRLTPQRALILEIIRQGHPDADEIYRRARKKEPRISLSTVYRNLQTLKELGLVDELHLDETHHHYELKPPAEHAHLVCLKCGKVVEFRHSLHEYIKRKVPEAKGFEITRTELRVAGYCPQCRQKLK